MKRDNKDAKFVIYQVLYIFVITVLALKGANLNLDQVVDKETAVDKSVRDSLLVIVDSLNQMGLKFNIEIDTNVVEENTELKEKLLALNKKMLELNKKIREEPEPEKEELSKPILPSPFSKTQTFIQDTWNVAENKSTATVNIIDPANPAAVIISIKPGESGKFDLQEQSEVILKYGEQEERVRVIENRPPEIEIRSVTTKMNAADIYVQELQRTTCFRVTVKDERLDQVQVSFTGPISVNGPNKDVDGNLIYNVSLRIAARESIFDEWMDANQILQEADGRYKVNFFFTAFDNRTKHRVQIGDSFFFTEFSK